MKSKNLTKNTSTLKNHS